MLFIYKYSILLNIHVPSGKHNVNMDLFNDDDDDD